MYASWVNYKHPRMVDEVRLTNASDQWQERLLLGKLCKPAEQHSKLIDLVKTLVRVFLKLRTNTVLIYCFSWRLLCRLLSQ